MGEAKEIPADKLEIDPMNVRPEPDLDEEIIDSVKEQGVIEPLIVRPEGDKFLVTVGKRRYHAAKRPG